MHREPTCALFIGVVALAVLASPALAHSELESQIEAVSEEIDAEGESASLLLKRGDLYRRHLDYASAQRDFDAARNADPGEPLIDFFEGRLALELGEPGRAVELLDRYLDERPDHAVGWLLRGRALLALAAPGRAAQDFSAAIVRSEHPGPDLYRLEVVSLIANQDPGAALDAVDKGLKALPGEVNLLGLGVDISLAMDDAATANAYLGEIPDGLFQIIRWQARARRAACLSEDTGIRRKPCLEEAEEVLNQEVRSFVARCCRRSQ